MSSITTPGLTSFTNVRVKNSLFASSLTMTNNSQALAPQITSVIYTNDFFEVGILNFTTQGAFTFATFICYQRNGRVVTIYTPAILQTATSAATLRTPPGLLPSYLLGPTSGGQNFVILAVDNGVNAFGVASVLGGGQIIWGNGASIGTFTNLAVCGTNATTFSYMLT